MNSPTRTGICHDCGLKHGSITPRHAITKWAGTCRWCGRYLGPDEGGVTASRHYGYPPEVNTRSELRRKADLQGGPMPDVFTDEEKEPRHAAELARSRFLEALAEEEQ
jgi:hypothetical protein